MTAKKLWEVELSDLMTVRLRCGCGATLELPLEKLGIAGDLRCPACKSDLRTRIANLSDPLDELQRAVARVLEHRDKFTVSFPIAAPDAPRA